MNATTGNPRPDPAARRLPTARRAGACLVAVTCCIGAAAVAGDGLRTLRYSEADGLSQSTVLAIAQDSRGFLWVGTEDGLNRFDGESFQVYRQDPADPSSLPDGFVRAIAEDAHGKLWIGTDGGGVACWDPTSDRFVRYRRLAGAPASRLAADAVQALVVDGRGFVWIGLRGAGLDRLDPVTGSVVHFRSRATDPASLHSDEVTALAESRDGALWVGTRDGVDRYDPATRTFRQVADVAVRALYEDRAGKLWVGTADAGLARIEPDTGRLTRYRHEEASGGGGDQVRAIAEDDLGRLWVGTLAGLEIFDRARGRFIRLEPEPGAIAHLGSTPVLSLHRDRGGAMWVGTHLAGLARWDGRTPAFAHHKVRPAGREPERGGDIVTSFAEDRDGRLYVGTFGAGLTRIDRATGELTRFRSDPSDPGSLTDDRVMALHRDRQGRLWIGTKQGGLNRMDPASGAFTSFRHDADDPASLGADGVMTLFEDAARTLWIGTFGGGLSRFDGDRAFRTYRHAADDPSSLGSDRVTSITSADRGRLWIGTDGGGLALFDPRTERCRSFRHQPSDASSLPADTVLALHRDAAGVLWAGTRGGGLARLDGVPGDGEPAHFRSFSERDGLPNSVIYAIRPDDGGGLWLSTNRGLSRFEPGAARFTNFDVRHGLQADEFNFGAAYRSDSGELFFGGINGYNAFHPEQLLGVLAEAPAAAPAPTTSPAAP